MTAPRRGACWLALLFAAAGPAAVARDLSILVSGIDPVQGELVCRLYSGGKGFPHEEQGDVVQTVRYPVSGDLVTCTFPGVPPGRYAVSVAHDLNGNGRFDRNLMGFPKEPWGVSNNVRPPNRAPRFGEASIPVSESRVAMHEIVLQR